jgi:hypothetical protein
VPPADTGGQGACREGGILLPSFQISDIGHELPIAPWGSSAERSAGPRFCRAQDEQAYIGGVMPSRPTEMAAASSVPSSFLLAAEMKILAPGLSSLLSPGT